MSISRNSAATAPLVEVMTKLDMDIFGAARLADVKETRLKEAAVRLLPGVKSVVVLGMELYPEILDLTSPGRTTGAPSMNDLYNNNTDFVSSRLTKSAYDLARASRRLGMKSLPLPAAGCPTDARFLEAVFSYKHAGEAAGMGEIGWHSLLITPEFGPRLRLSCCLTEAEFEPTTGEESLIDCKSCGLCIENCPSGALREPADGESYVMNKYACSSYRAAAGGCVECMKVCPRGR